MLDAQRKPVRAVEQAAHSLQRPMRQNTSSRIATPVCHEAGSSTVAVGALAVIVPLASL
ncbi:hypothetical protein [Rhizomonospora bruguierae]|uniref:hypothetical protein n=1 Tax=Rhizomonospora bruguierae TaxID=1581705 RepID=UPI001BCBC1C2|nr:hypothetical protein [Micromonospora sp. NBRC 107566]